ncbi:hypothetical protein DQ238_09440 [Geodermatophilus sp. TF02-6]|uniref:hypothetical protein n=1 Tax=Geodermatophilus sp. TF02-6 TaxID=2250575 RepID=UPI000DE90504|nr:hypothetical protein [Geodermatophilus sp. TF02-6]RBY79847.1 hypothetical protein DQ238_09440 [Geodermatophilus sp. TF02-6]
MTRATTARNVIGSLGVLGATAAVAGRGTSGRSTDSTLSVTTQVATGTVSIDLAQPAAATGLLPAAGTAARRALRPALALGRWSVHALVALAAVAFAVPTAGPHLLGHRT